jgi:hypothetical protein
MGVAIATGRLDVVVPAYNNKSFDKDSIGFEEQMKGDSEKTNMNNNQLLPTSGMFVKPAI